MNKNIYSQICNPANLNLAYAQIRMQTIRPPSHQPAVAAFERHLELNLEDLAGRLREGRYYPVSARIVESTGNSFSQTMRIIEDQIVQRAVFNALAPLFEPSLLDCSFGPHRNREAHVAVHRVLEYRAMGDNYIVKADISEGLSLFDYDNLIYLLGTQIDDQQLLRLIRMWLNCGRALPWAAKTEPQSHIPSSDSLLSSVDSVVMRLLERVGNDHWDDGHDWTFDDGRKRRDFKDAIKRLGIDAARITLESSLIVLASNPRYRHIFTKRNIALAAAAALAAEAYPAAWQLLREKSMTEQPRRVIRPFSATSCSLTGPLVGLMTDVALHRFDVALTGAGLRLVRYHDKFAITAQKESDAHFALERAVQELRRMDILLNPQTMRVARFEDGVEFLGYRIYEYENVAELIEMDEKAQFDHWYQHVSDVIRHAPGQLAPIATKIGGGAKARLSAGFRQIKSLITRNRSQGQEYIRY